jgi:hypothetical protein
MDSQICEEITRERLRKAIEGYSFRKPKGGEALIEGLGGGFRYCRLGPPIFEETGNIRAGVTFGELAAHVYFAETGEPLPKRNKGKTALLGVHNGKAIYLLFNGILGDRSPGGGNVLTGPVLKALPAPRSPPAPLPKGEGSIVRVVYGEGCRLGKPRLKREAVVFKQIPYGIKTT